jgi:hypothetical protein
MARVNKSKKNRAGKDWFCGRAGCGEKVLPGEFYYFWEPRYGPKQVRCYRHYPRQSETTTSKMAEVYSAVEDSQDWAGQYDGIESSDYESQIESVMSVVEEVKGEYEEAAENFGNAGPSQEMADDLDQFYSELQNADFDSFDEWKEANEDDADAWREDMASRMTEALDQAP